MVLGILFATFNSTSAILFLPLVALCHAFSAVILFKILRIFKISQISAVLGTVVFVVLPASYFWLFQILKENFYILGIFLYVFGICSAFIRRSNRKNSVVSIAAILSGCALIWISRPFFMPIYFTGLFFGGLFLLINSCRLHQRKILPVLFIIFSLFGNTIFPKVGDIPGEEMSAARAPEKHAQQFFLEKVVNARDAFFGSHPASTLEFDRTIHLENDAAVIWYIPRAIFAGLAAPIGTCRFSVPAIFFGVHSTLYLASLLFVSCWLVRRRFLWLLFGTLMLPMGIEMVARAVLTPNAGSLWRYLFAFKALCISLGSALFFDWMLRFIQTKKRTRFFRLANETAIVFAGRALFVVGSLVGIRLLTQFLIPELYGKLAMVMSIILVSQFVFGSSLEQVSMRYYSLMAEECGRGYLKQLIKWWLYAALILVVSISATNSMPALSLSSETLICAIVFAVLGAGLNLCRGILSAARSRIIVAGLESGFEWCRYLLAVLFIFWGGAKLFSVLLAFTVASVFILLVYGVAIFKTHVAKQKNRCAECNELSASYYWGMVLSGIFVWIQIFADRWAIFWFLPESDLGLYQALYQISFSPALVGSAFLLTLTAPILFQHSQDVSNHSQMLAIIKKNQKITVVLGTLFFTVFIGTFFYKSVLVNLLLGKAYRGTACYLPWMVLSGCLFMLSQQFILSLCAGLKIKALILFRAFCAGVAVVIYSLAVRLYGFSGAVFAGLIVSTFSAGIAYLFHVGLKDSYRKTPCVIR